MVWLGMFLHPLEGMRLWSKRVRGSQRRRHYVSELRRLGICRIPQFKLDSNRQLPSTPSRLAASLPPINLYSRRAMASATFEAQHVHQVYDHIAKDFSRTRHTRWPFVQHFMDKLESVSFDDLRLPLERRHLTECASVPLLVNRARSYSMLGAATGNTSVAAAFSLVIKPRPAHGLNSLRLLRTAASQ